MTPAIQAIRRWQILLVAGFLLVGSVQPIAAQGVPTPGGSASSSTSADAPATDSKAALETLIRSLEDPLERQELLEDLRRMQETQGAEPRTTESPLLSTTVVDEVTEELRRRSDTLLELGGDILESTEQLPALADWLVEQVTDEQRRALWLVVTTALVIILAVGLIARNRVLRWAPAIDTEHLYGDLAWRFGIEIAAALVFGVLTLGMLWVSDAVATTYDLDLSVVADAARSLGLLLFAAMLWRAVVRLLFGGSKTDGRLLHISDRTARVSRDGLLTVGRLGFLGFGLLYACFLIGLPEAVYLFLVHLLYLVVAFIAIVLVLRLRETIADSIRRWADETSAAWTRFVPARFLARTWHYFAILSILLHYLVWALKVPGGIVFLSRATLLSVAIVVVARLATVGINMMFVSDTPQVADADDLPAGEPDTTSRFARPARLLLRGAVLVLALVAIGAVWNTGVIEWLTSDIGLTLLGVLGRLALIAGFTVIAFELTRHVARRFINDKDEHGKAVHNNRTRTLAGIAANGFYFIFGMAGLFTSLNQLGVEAAPLLAGAGVVGLAIGFGSQALVKDLITGLFMLLGDILRIGDVVDIAGKAGVVEEMSMRTITLRSYDGSVHIIPYGSVDVVTNMTKEFSYALLDVGVAYRENTDEVIRVMREIDDRMRKEWPYRRLILEPIDVAGVDNLDSSAVVIRMRSKTRAGEQWGIRREFLRRIKLKFDELGIEIPYPHQTIYWGSDKTGRAPPLRIETTSRELRDAADGNTDATPPEPLGMAANVAEAPPEAAKQRRAGSN